MRVYRLLVVASVALMSTLPSMAQHPNLKNYHHDRIQVQLIDTTPIFSDHRHQLGTSPTYVIEAPMATQPAPPPLMIRPSGQNTPVVQNMPGVTILQNGLPNAGFESNISPNQGRMITNLPNGMSTNMLAGRMLNNQPKPLSSKSVAVNSAPKLSPVATPVKTLVYSSQPSSSGMHSQSVRTAVSGQLQRGSMLAHH